jgi:hypothetical protein
MNAKRPSSASVLVGKGDRELPASSTESRMRPRPSGFPTPLDNAQASSGAQMHQQRPAVLEFTDLPEKTRFTTIVVVFLPTDSATGSDEKR